VPPACPDCACPLTPDDLDTAETTAMEADRVRAGLRGVRFRYYVCPACGAADIVVTVLPLKGESADRFGRRRAEMEAVARAMHADRPGGAAAVVVRVADPV
jgi:hypothetical protein